MKTVGVYSGTVNEVEQARPSLSKYKPGGDGHEKLECKSGAVSLKFDNSQHRRYTFIYSNSSYIDYNIWFSWFNWGNKISKNCSFRQSQILAREVFQSDIAFQLRHP
jgi:hypothetical protein